MCRKQLPKKVFLAALAFQYSIFHKRRTPKLQYVHHNCSLAHNEMNWFRSCEEKKEEEKKEKKIQLCGMLAELNLFWLVGVDLFLYWFLPTSSQWEENSVLSFRANFHTCTSPFLMFNSPTTCLSLTNNYFHFCYSWTSSKSLKKKEKKKKHPPKNVWTKKRQWIYHNPLTPSKPKA